MGPVPQNQLKVVRICSTSFAPLRGSSGFKVDRFSLLSGPFSVVLEVRCLKSKSFETCAKGIYIYVLMMCSASHHRVHHGIHQGLHVAAVLRHLRHVLGDGLGRVAPGDRVLQPLSDGKKVGTKARRARKSKIHPNRS